MIVTNSLTGGGAERSMNLVSNELTKRGWPIALVPINFSEPDLIAPICDVFPLNRQWRGGVFNTLTAIVKFNRLIRSWKPGVIVFNCDLPELFGAFYLGSIPLVVIEHSNIAWTNRILLGKIVRKVLLQRKTIWASVSSHLPIWPGGNSPQMILQNPLMPLAESVNPTRNFSSLGRLVFIGRLAPEKRPELMLEIGERSGFEIVIIGDGVMRDSLQSEAEARNLNITFLGQVRNPWSQTQSGDLLIVPSESEGDGLVIIEGLQRGMPLLLSDIPDFRRFELPNKNYCQNIEDFVTRIQDFEDRLSALVAPKVVSDAILATRSLRMVGDEWEKFLTSVSSR